jgi:hypothetical protein
MHRIDGDANYPTGHFSEGDPLVPRLPTQVTASWLEDVQEEIVSVVLGAGLSLLKGSAQLGAVVANLNVAQTFTALKSFIRAGQAMLVRNSDAGSTSPALVVEHTGGLQRALEVTGDTLMTGYQTVTQSIVSTAGNIQATAGDIRAAAGTVTAQRVVATGNGDPGAPALNLPVYSNGWPSTISVGDVWLQTSGGNLTLYVQSGPATRYSVALTLVP